MPITSHQVGGFIGGQQAMFGNFASYATQISPMGQMGGPPPTYQNPMGGTTGFEAPPPPGDPAFSAPGYNQIGTSVMSGVGNVGLPAAAGAMMLGGAMMPGAVGGAFRGIDPFSRGLSAFGRGVGWQGGAGMGANFGKMASMGAGGIARAGLMGLGSAAVTALPLMAIGGAMKYGVGQMVEGAQFQNQVGGFLQNQFRHLNPQSESGYGFSRGQQSQIGNVVREMGSQEIMSSPQEMLRLMKQGTGMGLFTAVQDAKEFKTRFKEMIGAVKEIATTMNTTLEGAMPFMRQARQMGFWTPQDIMRQAQSVKATAATTGMSVAQVQMMQGQGAAMSRAIGAQGATGAIGMQRTLDLTGGALRSGVIGQQELSDMTGGLQGPEAVQAVSQTLMQSTMRFAASNRGRWTIAALANRNMQGFDPGRMAAFARGDASIGQIGNWARQNVGGGNRFNFVMNEEKLRGQIMEMGSEAQVGFVRSIVGDRLYDESAKGQYITRVLLKRQTGVDSKLADAMAKMAREAPRILSENQRRSDAVMDQGARDTERALNESWDGAKRQMGKWWEGAVNEPLQKMGTEMSRGISETYGRWSDKVWGRSAARNRVGSVTADASRALQRYALGDTKAAEIAFGRYNGENRGGEGVTMELTGAHRMMAGLAGASPELGQLSGKTAGVIGAALGSRTAQAAQAMGFQSVTEMQEKRQGLKEEMLDLLRSGETLNLHFQLGGKKGLAYGQALVEGIRGGTIKAGAQIQELVKGGTAGGAAMRLAAMQTDETRKLRTGIDVGADMEGVRLMGGGAHSAKQAEQGVQAAEERMAEALTKAKPIDWGAVGKTTLAHGVTAGAAALSGQMWHKDVSTDDIGRLRSLKGDRGTFEEATKYNAEADAAEKEAVDLEQGGRSGPAAEKRAESNRLRKRSRNILEGIATDEGTDPREATLLTRLLSMDDKERGNLMSGMGRSLQDLTMESYKETTGRRMDRVRSSMSTEAKEKLLSLGGSAMEGLLNVKGQSPFDRAENLKTLINMSGQDPDKAEEMLKQLQGISGAAELTEAISGGAGAGRQAETLTGGGDVKRKMGAAKTFLHSLGMVSEKVTTQMMKDLTSGNAAKSAKAMSQIEKLAPADTKTVVTEALSAIREGGEGGKAKLLEIGRRGVLQRSLRTVAGGQDQATVEGQLRQDLTTDKDKLKIQGTLGSPEGMHKELSLQTALLRNIETALGKMSGVGSVQNPTPVTGKPP